MNAERRLIRQTGSWDEMRRAFRWNAPARFNIARACAEDRAAADPDATALIHVTDSGVERWSAERLNASAARFASVLASSGVGRGDRVAILLSQGPETLIAHLGAMRLGAVSLPLFTLFGEDALAYRLADSGARAAVTDPANLDRLMALDLPDLQSVWCTGPARVRSFADDIAAASPAPVPTPPPMTRR